MNYKDLAKLIELIDESNLSEFKMKDGEFSVRIRTDKYADKSTAVGPQVVQVPQAPPAIQSATPAESTPAGKTDKQEDAAPATEQEDSTAGLVQVKSPIVGTFYRSASPDKPPYVKVGDTIGEGDIVCIVEAMKLFNEIESEVSGKIVKVLVEDATPVEYDQALFLVDPQG